MAAQRDEFKLGVTVIIIVALFFGTLFFIAGTAEWRRPTQSVRVRFSHSLNLPVLKPGGEVRCGGQRVGTIKQVDLQELPALGPDGRPRRPATTAPAGRELAVVVTARIDRAVALQQDCKISADGPTLGGSGWLVIRDRGRSGQPLRPDQIVAGQPPTGLAAATDTLGQLGQSLARQLDAARPGSLLGKLHRSLDDINILTANLKNQLDPDQQQAILGKLRRSADNLNFITAQLRHQLDPRADKVLLAKTHQAIDSVNAALEQVVLMLKENRPPVRSTLQHVERTARRLDEQISQAIADQLDIRRHASLMAKVHRDVELMGQVLSDIDAITSNARQMVLLNRGNIERMLANFKQTSDHLKAASKDLRQNPWRLLYQPSQKELQELGIFDAARAFAEAATQLDDAAIRLDALARSQQTAIAPDDPQLLELRQQLRSSFEKFSAAEAALWTKLDIR